MNPLARFQVLLLAAGGLAGCSVLSPLPVWELTKGAGQAASHFLGSPRAVDTVAQGAVMPRSLCLTYRMWTELNSLVVIYCSAEST